jgi:hypothetical protein
MKSDQATSWTAHTALAAVQVFSTQRASSAQASSFSKMSGLSRLSVTQRMASLPSTSRSFSSTPSTSSTPLLLTPIISNLAGLPQPAPTLTEQEQAFQLFKRNKHSSAIFEQFKMHFYRYKEEPFVPENESLDLVQWWDVSGLHNIMGMQVFPFTWESSHHLTFLPTTPKSSHTF